MMPPFVTRTWLNGRENGDDARWNAVAANDLEQRIATAVGSGVGGGSAQTVIGPEILVANKTIDMSALQDVFWIVTAAASLVKLEVTGWSVGKSVVIVYKQDSNGARDIRMPTAKWPNGAAPITTQAPNAIDAVVLWATGSGEVLGQDAGRSFA